jgi:membrane-associated PAP2 superfamily phosphatase
MNRTGLFVALALALFFGLLFGVYPGLDLKITALFYNPATKTFPLQTRAGAEIIRFAAMWISWAFTFPAMIALIVKLARPVKPLMMSGRAMTFLLVTIFLSAIILPNAAFKSHWSRPRPTSVAEFNGNLKFMPWWDPRGQCPKNCSFFSGEGATAFWTYAPATLAPPAWRPLAYAGATAFGIAISGGRVAFGGHFFTDVVAAALVTFFVIWLAYALIYRWPSTRLTDEGVDAWLTRVAWPGYRWLQKRRGHDVGPAPRLRPGTDTASATGSGGIKALP